MGAPLTTVLLDTHVVLWWSSHPDRLSEAAVRAIEGADEIALAGITWFELAWLAERHRITVPIPVRAWIDALAGQVRTVGISPSIAHAAVQLPDTFPGDRADRLILATAVEHGWPLVTKDRRLRDHPASRTVAVW